MNTCSCGSENLHTKVLEVLFTIEVLVDQCLDCGKEFNKRTEL